MIGRSIGHYRVLASVGAGCMGEVFRAQDTKLGREVALKVLPAELASDPSRLERFEREARALAALNHPAIVTIHSVEEALLDGEGGEPGRRCRFLTMELVEGRTLDGLVKPGPIALPDLLGLVKPIVEALAAAHEKGIVHRDLKPGNVMISEDGRVKVLDFGLAKRSEDDSAGDDSALATLAQDLTGRGMLVGTPAYMSPEQVRGEPADARSDLFALGLMLYELASGTHPFRRGSPMETASAILQEPTPELAPKVSGTHPLLEHLIAKLLAKDPNARYQTARGLLADLSSLLEGAAAASQGEPSVPGRFSIVVLPFANRSADPENEFLAEGISEDLINDLARFEDVKVVARTSAFQFRGREQDVREIGARLGVTTVLEGSVRAAGNRLRVTAQLIDANDGCHLWSERFDREKADIFDIQDEITAAIGERIRSTVGGGLRHATPRKAPTDRNAEAHTAFMKGRHRMMELTPAGMESARKYFDRALEIDSQHADTHAALSWLAINLSHFGGKEPQPLYEEARAHAEKALAVSNAVADAHGGLGFVYMYADWDWVASEEAFLRGLELAPSSAALHLYYGCLLSVVARHEEAVEAMARAQELDPLAGIVNGAVGLALIGAGRYEEAIRECTRGIEIDPDYWLTYAHRAHGWCALGRVDKAVADYQAAWDRSRDPWALGGLINSLERTGRTDEAEQRMADFEALAEGPFVRPFHWAMLKLTQGRLDEGFTWYEKSLDARDSLVSWIPETALFRGSPAEADPRFAAMRQRLGIAPRSDR